jgi:hypothetical protein
LLLFCSYGLAAAPVVGRPPGVPSLLAHTFTSPMYKKKKRTAPSWINLPGVHHRFFAAASKSLGSPARTRICITSHRSFPQSRRNETCPRRRCRAAGPEDSVSNDDYPWGRCKRTIRPESDPDHEVPKQQRTKKGARRNQRYHRQLSPSTTVASRKDASEKPTPFPAAEANYR